jgi:hypothetical protein
MACMTKDSGVRFILDENKANGFVYHPPNVGNSHINQILNETFCWKFTQNKLVKENTMELIKSKRVLHSKIKEILERVGDDVKSFPVKFSFSEGMGEPVFTFTIERSAEDHFIDEKGQKWVKAD